MIYSAETLTLQDGREIIIRSVEPEDAAGMLQYRAELGIPVRKDYWHQGIGSVLMERLISFAKQSGFEQIELTVESKNQRALRLYHKTDS